MADDLLAQRRAWEQSGTRELGVSLLHELQRTGACLAETVPIRAALNPLRPGGAIEDYFTPGSWPKELQPLEDDIAAAQAALCALPISWWEEAVGQELFVGDIVRTGARAGLGNDVVIIGERLVENDLERIPVRLIGKPPSYLSFPHRLHKAEDLLGFDHFGQRGRGGS